MYTSTFITLTFLNALHCHMTAVISRFKKLQMWLCSWQKAVTSKDTKQNKKKKKKHSSLTSVKCHAFMSSSAVSHVSLLLSIFLSVGQWVFGLSAMITDLCDSFEYLSIKNGNQQFQSPEQKVLKNSMGDRWS